jgi:hypothetical protein
VGLILGWVTGIAVQTVVSVYLARRPIPWTAWRTWIGAAVISLGLLEVWRTQGRLIWVPIIPQTALGAFVGGYLVDLVASALLGRLWSTAKNDK